MNIYECIETLARKHYFTLLDMASGYWQVPPTVRAICVKDRRRFIRAQSNALRPLQRASDVSVARKRTLRGPEMHILSSF